MRDFISLQATGNTEILKLHKMLEDETYQKGRLEEEIAMLRSQLLQLSLDADEVWGYLWRIDTYMNCEHFLDGFFFHLGVRSTIRSSCQALIHLMLKI